MPFLLRRDRPVQNSVHKAGNRRHRRFQLMRNVRGKTAARIFRRGKRLRHIVQRHGKLSHLVIAGYFKPGVEFTASKPLGSIRHLTKRLNQLNRNEIDRNRSDNQYCCGRNEKYLNHFV